MEATAPTFFVAAGAELTLTDLPTDALGLVLYQLTLAHDIARVGLTNRALKAAALAALKLRPFSGEVVTLAGHGEVSNPHAGQVHSVIATAPPRAERQARPLRKPRGAPRAEPRRLGRGELGRFGLAEHGRRRR